MACSFLFCTSPWPVTCDAGYREEGRTLDTAPVSASGLFRYIYGLAGLLSAFPVPPALIGELSVQNIPGSLLGAEFLAVSNGHFLPVSPFCVHGNSWFCLNSDRGLESEKIFIPMSLLDLLSVLSCFGDHPGWSHLADNSPHLICKVRGIGRVCPNKSAWPRSPWPVSMPQLNPSMTSYYAAQLMPRTVEFPVPMSYLCNYLIPRHRRPRSHWSHFAL